MKYYYSFGKVNFCLDIENFDEGSLSNFRHDFLEECVEYKFSIVDELDAP